jgi:hypothetical protein
MEISSEPFAQGPALSQLTSWIYCLSARAQVFVDDVLPEHLVGTYAACLDWYESMLHASKDSGGGSGPFNQ